VRSRGLRVAYVIGVLIFGVLAAGRLVLEGAAAAAGPEAAGEPLTRAGGGLLTLGLGAAILSTGRPDRSARLFGIALLAVGGTGLDRAVTGDFLLPAVATAAFAWALLCYPPAGGPLDPGRDEIAVTVGGCAVLGAATAAKFPPTVSYIALFGVVVPALAVVLLRHRRRDDLTAIERTQIRLLFGVLATAAAVTAVLLLVFVAVPAARDPAPPFWFSHLVPVAVAVIGSRRDRVHAIQRGLGIGLGVALVSALIGGLFVALHTVLPGPVAAVPAALLLHPVHVRVERRLSRLLHGRRPTPYSVLAGVGTVSRVGDAPDLARVAEAVGRGLGARVCRLTVHRPELPDRAYAWTRPGAGEEDALVTLPISRGAEELGSISVDRAAATGPDVHRPQLFADVADSLGAVFEANRLGVELERQLRAVRAHAADIARSRSRLVSEMDAERRRLERDLHDGAQHHLVSLRLAIGLAEHRVTTGSAEDAAASLDRVTGQIDDAESVMARTAIGAPAPRLARLGLIAALEAELGLPVTTGAMAAGRRFPAELESAVWFCCLEAVNNARKYAPGAPLRLALTCDEDRLSFGVHDDGPGWDVAASGGSLGRGLRNVTARVRAAGGRATVRSEPGAGTRVDGWVPLPGGHGLISAVRDAVRDALARYGDSPAAAEIRLLRDDLDGPAGDGRTRRETVLTAGSALRALDQLVGVGPPETGASELRHRLELIRAGTHELAEVDAIDTLRSSPPGDLDAGEAERAARLLGESGPDACSRLGLVPEASPSLIAATAQQAVPVWRSRGSHPGASPGLRLLAATVVRSCERLLSRGA
jgi:signal transduction histidine kinase